MALQIQKAKRKKIWTKIALMAPSGAGKTYSALRLATGMKMELDRTEPGKDHNILMVNTEGDRGLYYANEFDYDIITLEAPFNPEKFTEAIELAVNNGYSILVMDGISQEWDGIGGCLDLHKQAGGTYQAWSKVTPRHNRFMHSIVTSNIHIIATMRGKDQYEVEKDDRGKTSVKKLGVGAKQRDGFEYEFTCTFLIDLKTHTIDVQKDNTHIFENTAEQLSEAHGEKIIRWANSGQDETSQVEPTVKPASIDPATKLKDTKAEIIKLANTLIKSNPYVMDIIKKYVASGNPNMIKDQKVANTLLTELKGL